MNPPHKSHEACWFPQRPHPVGLPTRFPRDLLLNWGVIEKKRKLNHFPSRKTQVQPLPALSLPTKRKHLAFAAFSWLIYLCFLSGIPPAAKPPTVKRADSIFTTPPPSTLGSALTSFNSQKAACTPPKEVTRSNGFSEKSSARHVADTGSVSLGRNDDLTVAEDLVPGPIDHPPPFDDPHFEHIEPNSRINLRFETLRFLRSIS